MKNKYTIIYRDEQGSLQECVVVAPNAREAKARDGFVAITKTERIKQPSQMEILNYLQLLEDELFEYENAMHEIDHDPSFSFEDEFLDSLEYAQMNHTPYHREPYPGCYDYE